MNTVNQKQLTEWLNTPISENDIFYIGDRKFHALGQRGSKMICCDDGKDNRLEISIDREDIVKKAEDFKGPNPFLPQNIRFTAFGLESIYTYLGIDRRNKVNEKDDEMPFFNWNPYFIINGEKVHYQRGYVWSLEQKQALIDTIYRGLEAGRVIVHKHSWDKQERMVKAGFTDFASRDIVDGKQRLSTIVDFTFDKFTDRFGNLYSELSKVAQRKFMQYQGLMYGEMDENCTIDQICDAFINNTTAGVPISQEHIDFIKEVKTNNTKSN